MNSVRKQYEELGVSQYYAQLGQDYDNPHTDRVVALLKRLPFETSTIADIACGDGLVTKTLNYNTAYGVDPYLGLRYTNDTGNVCIVADFKQMITRQLPDADVAIISYAIDLVDPDILPSLLYKMSTVYKRLITIRPNKHILSTPYFKEAYKDKEQQTQLVVYESTIIGLL